MEPWTVGFYPFWFWNDILSADEIQWQIDEMADKGIRGFYIHPRQGLGQPYLSDAFFEMVAVAIETAEAHGLIVHLYDEYPYPSGIAGGEVTLGCPEYQATRLVHRFYDLAGGPVALSLPRGQILCCKAYPVVGESVDWANCIDLRDRVGIVLVQDSCVETGLTAYNRKRYFASEPTPVLDAELLPGRYRLYVTAQVVVDHHKYWGHYVDVLNPDAILRYLTLTHERYRRRFQPFFGNTICSIFTDEVRPIWSSRVPRAFQTAYGYNLCEMFPALQDESHPEHVQVTVDLQRLLYDMFVDAFERPVSTLCAQYGLAYAGEKPSLRMAQLGYMDVPGCEPGHIKVGAKLDLLQGPLRSNAKATASAAYFYDKLGSLCECYHSTGWSATLQDAKFVADGLLLMGISWLVPHGFFYSTHGLRKHDAPPTFFFQMPFWPLFGELSAYVERVGQILAGTFVDADVLVVEPSGGVPSRQDQDIYEQMMWKLMSAHIDFHFVDTDILARGQISDGKVSIKEISAHTIIVPPMRVLENPLRAWLERFAAEGGIVFYGDCDSGLSRLQLLIDNQLQPSLSIQKDGDEVGAVLSVQRRSERGRWWFLLNTSDRAIEVELTSGGELYEMSLHQGAETLSRMDVGRYQRKIAPFESLVVASTTGKKMAVPLPRLTIAGDGPAQVHPDRPNLLRMHEWRLYLLDEKGHRTSSAVVSAVPLVHQLDQGGLAFAPAYTHFFGHTPEMSLPTLDLCYEFAFECAYDGAIELVMEPGSVVGNWHICINGRRLNASDFKPTASHIRGSLSVDVSASISQGANTIALYVETNQPGGGLINPLYLAGGFGVSLDPLRLVPRPSSGCFEDYEGNLLPYYAGAIRYETRFVLDEVPSSEAVILDLTYSSPFHEASEVAVNKSPRQLILWQPRSVKLSTEYLKRGENVLWTTVYTTLIRSFEGQWFDYGEHRYRDVGQKLR